MEERLARRVLGNAVDVPGPHGKIGLNYAQNCADGPTQVRCVFRVIEFSQGYDGQLRTTEWYFYVFDSLPLILAISVWVFIWPEKYFKEKLSQDAYALATSMYP